jgi:hypothetical protein
MRKYPSAKALAKITKPGRYAVGHGAYLQISEWGTRAWVLRYRNSTKATHMGLGSCEYVSLQEARQKAWEAQRQRLNGVDPLEAKREAQGARRPTATIKCRGCVPILGGPRSRLARQRQPQAVAALLKKAHSPRPRPQARQRHYHGGRSGHPLSHLDDNPRNGTARPKPD